MRHPVIACNFAEFYFYRLLFEAAESWMNISRTYWNFKLNVFKIYLTFTIFWAYFWNYVFSSFLYQCKFVYVYSYVRWGRLILENISERHLRLNQSRFELFFFSLNNEMFKVREAFVTHQTFRSNILQLVLYYWFYEQNCSL